MHIDTVRAAYRRYAGVYDLVFGKSFEAGRQQTLDRINARKKLRILEVGVGTGLSLPDYNPDHTIVGIDASEEMLNIARERVAKKGIRNVESLVEMDAQKMTFEDHSFDVVVAMYVMTVVEDPQAVMDELKRVCKPGGDIYIVNHFSAEKAGLRLKFERMIANFAELLGWHADMPMSPLLSNAGIEIVTIAKLPPFGMFTMVHCRNSDSSGGRMLQAVGT
ncbi:class I SAM-dependent methyltransferase [Skermanella rosea]|uniref:class I SAM-dependent methyltransferase n=1 Tax=Skermanella rosea TaxID=1817965 RepID=UPI001931F22D|nr:class I SAM-dependent methyltransferase [Skermanella rosea]UEM03887.1 class I SAM-dependent methyltransferase [Skermanella rosea]